jgi:hypothetical protein
MGYGLWGGRYNPRQNITKVSLYGERQQCRVCGTSDRLCGLVVRVQSPEIPGLILGATRFSEKYWV